MSYQEIECILCEVITKVKGELNYEIVAAGRYRLQLTMTQWLYRAGDDKLAYVTKASY